MEPLDSFNKPVYRWVIEIHQIDSSAEASDPEIRIETAAWTPNPGGPRWIRTDKWSVILLDLQKAASGNADFLNAVLDDLNSTARSGQQGRTFVDVPEETFLFMTDSFPESRA